MCIICPNHNFVFQTCLFFRHFRRFHPAILSPVQHPFHPCNIPFTPATSLSPLQHPFHPFNIPSTSLSPLQHPFSSLQHPFNIPFTPATSLSPLQHPFHPCNIPFFLHLPRLLYCAFRTMIQCTCLHSCTLIMCRSAIIVSIVFVYLFIITCFYE